MALFTFTKSILADEPIRIFNHGKHRRDFTYIDDIVEGVIRVLDQSAAKNEDWDGKKPDPSTSQAPYRIYNIGNSQPIELMDYVIALEMALGKVAKKELLPLQLGDVLETHADIRELLEDFKYSPITDVQTGINKFVAWYQDYYAMRGTAKHNSGVG
jgi:UDP-glucuronate 4-epimerase